MSLQGSASDLPVVDASGNVALHSDYELPQEVAVQVIRFLSARPRHRYVQCFVSVRDVFAVHHSSEPLRSAARKLFHSVASLAKRRYPTSIDTFGNTLLVEEGT